MRVFVKVTTSSKTYLHTCILKTSVNVQIHTGDYSMNTNSLKLELQKNYVAMILWNLLWNGEEMNIVAAHAT